MVDTTLFIPPEPDSEAQKEVDDSMHGSELSSSITCQVEIHCEAKTWVLHTRDAQGQRRKLGGDELYIRYEEYKLAENSEEELILFQAVAMITDKSDGSYELDFVTPPLYSGLEEEDNGDHAMKRLTVYLEYSNHLGTLPPPEKALWKNGGYTHKHYSCKSHFRPPNIRRFSPPINSINLKCFDRVFAFGDSTMDQFTRQRSNKKDKYYFQSNIRVGEKMALPMNSSTVHTHLQSLEEQFGSNLLESSSTHSTALILGSCLWDILDAHDTLQGRTYADHLDSCRYFLEQLKARYPKVTLIWKSPMAVHIHWVDLERLIEHDRQTATLFGIDRVRYMSASRSKFLYDSQKQLMKELDIPMLDLHQATFLSADQLYPSDGRHYRPDLNRLMLQWFYRDPSTNAMLVPTEKYFTNNNF